MEIDRVSFPGHLLDILEAISTADFVSFDLELSGVASNSNAGRRIQSLEERYHQVKSAAERYQILQVGITCARREKDGSYVLRPYNFNLGPTVDDELKVERIFAFQSGAVNFLMRNGFAMDLPFRLGVPYLSRREEDEALLHAAQRSSGTSVEDIQLAETDVDALAFMAKVRREIDAWLKTRRPTAEAVSIQSRTATWADMAGAAPDLTNFEKRLVHQLVRAEYEGLSTSGKNGAVVVRHFDRERDKGARDRWYQRSRKQINHHVGFRWIVEALCCDGNIKELDLNSLAVDSFGTRIEFDFYAFTARHGRISKALETRRPVIVGHNVLIDLVNLYQCFVGQLPDSVAKFQTELHRVFPRIVDTKYLATHDRTDMIGASSLEDLEGELGDMKQPEINVHPAHSAYNGKEAYHEAGFDSFLTAKVMILLSARLALQDMPDFDSPFWKSYMNRLRVFGTAEKLMELAND